VVGTFQQVTDLRPGGSQDLFTAASDHSSANDHEVWIEQRNQVRQSPPQPAARLFKEGVRPSVP
jgi:hypothetical protein